MSNGYTYDRADAVRIESDERGFELHIDTTLHGTIVVDIHGVVEDLWDQMVKQVGPYLLEKRAAEREYRTGIADDPEQQKVLDRIKGQEPDDVLDTIYGHNWWPR